MSQFFFASGGQVDEYNSYQNLTKILLKIPDTVMYVCKNHQKIASQIQQYLKMTAYPITK